MIKSLALAGFGALIVLVAVGAGLSNADLVMRGERVEALVESSQYKHSVLTAELPDGSHRFQADGLNEVLEVGSRVEVVYLPDDPANFSLHSTSSLWGAPLAIGSFGSLFMMLGVIGLKPESRD